MLYDDDGERIGYATSLMYSPMLQRHIAMARVRPELAAAGYAGQPRAHHQPPVRDGRGRRHPASVLQPTAKDGLTMASTDKNYDAIIVGGGHNGLVNGAYLAKAGLKVLIVERRHLVGGAAITEELRPGFQLHDVLLRAEPAAARHRPGARPGQARLHADPDAVVVRADGERRLPAARPGPRREHQGDHAALAARRRRDGPLRVRRRAGLPARQAAARQGAAEHLRQVAGGPRRDRRAGRSTSAASSQKVIHDLVRLLTGSAADFLDDYFESDILKGYIASSGIIGTKVGPMSQGSGLVLLYHSHRRARRALRRVVVPQGRQRRLHPGAGPRGAGLRRRDHAQRRRSTR